jgi:uncharacterized protein YaiE (UPF0345 family)
MNSQEATMPESAPEKFENVTLVCKANVYFDGKVISHTLFFPDRSKKTLGLIFSGSFRFDTEAPERMEIVAGTCRFRLAGEQGWTTAEPGTSFFVPGKSVFEIAVDEGIAEYICSFG